MMSRRLRCHLPLALLFTLAALPLLAAEPLAIQDNSFLIEEAYNQEAGVVQHISTFMRSRDGAYVSTFTQEWPAGGLAHQLSYTLPLQRLADPRQRGLGDALVNYRYQLVGDGNARVAVAPRLSVILPTGSARRGLGAGGYGLDVNVPVSVAINDRFVTHWNAGATKVPSSAEPVTWSAGASAIVAPLQRVHLMLETRWTRNDRSVVTVSPGVRWAWDIDKLQVVPGIAVPIGSDHTRALFLYLSFEHPFRR
jgi:hypothetical protein